MKIDPFFSCWKTLFLAPALACLMAFPERTQAQGCSGGGIPCEMESRSVSFRHCKSGYGEWCNVSSPPKYYLQQTYVREFDASHDDVSRQERIDAISQWNPWAGIGFWTSVSGTIHSEGPGWSCDATLVPTNTACEIFDTTNCWAWYPGDCGGPSGPSPFCVDYSEPCSSTVYEEIWTLLSECSDYGTYEVHKTFTLSTEYTDSLLKSHIMARLPENTNTWQAGSGTAFWSLDCTNKCGAAGKMEYRVKVPNSIKGVTYLIEWNEKTTTYSCSNGVSVAVTTSVPKREVLKGTGDPINPVLGEVKTVDVPEATCTITETTPVATIKSSRLPGH